MLFYLIRNGERTGAYTETELRDLLAAGAVGPEDLAWHEGLADWTALRALLPEPLPLPEMPPVPDCCPKSVPADRRIRLLAKSSTAPSSWVPCAPAPYCWLSAFPARLIPPRCWVWSWFCSAA